MIFILVISKGHNSINHMHGVTFLNPYTSSDDVIIFLQSSVKIS